MTSLSLQIQALLVSLKFLYLVSALLRNKIHGDMDTLPRSVLVNPAVNPMISLTIKKNHG